MSKTTQSQKTDRVFNQLAELLKLLELQYNLSPKLTPAQKRKLKVKCQDVFKV